MEITKIANKIKCDFPVCKNLASTCLAEPNDKNKRLNLCDECVKKIYECVARVIVPKGVEAPYKKVKKLS